LTKIFSGNAKMRKSMRNPPPEPRAAEEKGRMSELYTFGASSGMIIVPRRVPRGKSGVKRGFWSGFFNFVHSVDV
jgi:hypothetical protein